MKKQDNTPMWVFLAFASIETRRGALLMILCNVLFSIYCLPWSQFVKDVGWIQKVFLFHGWFWFAVMVAMTLWYWMSFKWIDRHEAWSKPVAPEATVARRIESCEVSTEAPPPLNGVKYS